MVNMCFIIFPVSAIPGHLITPYVFKEFKTASVLRVVSLIFMLGALLRFISFKDDEFWPMLLGSVIMALVCPFMFDAIILVTN